MVSTLRNTEFRILSPKNPKLQTDDERRTTNDQRPTTNDERPTTNEQRRTTNDERRTTNDERRTMATKTTTNDERQTTNDDRGDETSACSSFSRNADDCLLIQQSTNLLENRVFLIMGTLQYKYIVVDGIYT